MAYRKLAGIDEKILHAIWQLGAKEGVKKVTARKVGALCGVSDYTVFCHFGNSNQGFLDAAANHFFSQCLDPLLARIAQGGALGDLWDLTLDTFLHELDGALYFKKYCAAFGLPEQRFPSEHPMQAAKALTAATPNLSEQEQRFMFDFFLTSAFHYAEYLSSRMQNTAETRSFLRTMICRALGAAT
ncbi:MAG: hypothetical protein IKL99_00360 [Oscillospiraceae bacterium]|nr:hypothetical protein [Oscillospiraceae bacterium]